MAYPKTPEELKIYKELLEKYKNDPETIEMIEWQAQDESDKQPWAEAKPEIEMMANDGWIGAFPIGTYAMRGMNDKKKKNKE